MASPSPVPPPRDRHLFIDAMVGQRSFRYAAAIGIVLAVMARWPRLGLPVATGVAAVLLLGWMGQSRWLARRARRAVLSASAGDAHAAAETWDACACWSFGRQRATALLSAGMLRFRAGELGPARDALAAVEQSHGLVPARYGQGVASFLSLVLALQGECQAAAGWAVQARRRRVPAGLGAARLHLVAEAVVAARGGDPAGAATRLEQAWPELEASYEPGELRRLRLLRAYLRQAAGQSPDDAEVAALAREHRWMGAGWPALATYVAQAAVAGEAPARA